MPLETLTNWKSGINPGLACWNGYRELIRKLPARAFPGAAVLNGLLPPDIRSAGGARIRFVPAGQLAGVQYERHIHETGEVSTRENNWHDLFNALVWCRLPQLKVAMNSLHYQHLDREQQGRRGKMRDALTLFDESGVIVYGSNIAVLEALVCRDWDAAFTGHESAWREDLQVLVCGHAILEKFLDPYKAITAHAMILQTEHAVPLEQLDSWLAAALGQGLLFDSSAGLSPLPLMGIPGWWPGSEQDQQFYQDRSVFRPPPPQMKPAPTYRVQGLDDPGHFNPR